MYRGLLLWCCTQQLGHKHLHPASGDVPDCLLLKRRQLDVLVLVSFKVHAEVAIMVGKGDLQHAYGTLQLPQDKPQS